METQHAGTRSKRIVFFVNILSAIVFFFFGSCNSEDGKVEWPNEKDLLQKIIPVINTQDEDFKNIVKYSGSIYLFNEMSSECYKYQYTENFEKVKPFVVERAAYSLVALLMDNSSTNIDYEMSSSTRKNDTIKIVDIHKDIPDLVLASTTVRQTVTTPVELSSINRIVGAFHIELTDVPQDITEVEVIINGLYDMSDYQGQYGFTTGKAASKKFLLTKEGNVFLNKVTVFPSDININLLSVNFRVLRNGQSENFTTGLAGGILANQIASIKGKAEDILKNAQIPLQITYLPWENKSLIEDNIIVSDDLNKIWRSKLLPIGGKAGAGYDNFWASSSLVNEWSKLYDSYLYDGIKDIDHKDEYWGPDVAAEQSLSTIPGWYIDLGGLKQGITITYWNKFGGAGGQKIRTMEIFGSNSKEDYEGGNSNWMLISNFFSEKTLPSIDAGAEVSTGRILFDEGDTSYRYIKCAITSRVDNNGNVVMDSDVNVSEVEITVWTCK